MQKEPILIYVEDDPLSVRVMSMVVERVMGLRAPVVFQDSDRFLEKLDELAIKPDLFMLDIHIKPYTGFELLAMLRKDKRFKKSKVIALTASVMGEEVDRLKASGFDGAIAKPLNITVFPDLIKRVLNGESVWYVS